MDKIDYLKFMTIDEYRKIKQKIKEQEKKDTCSKEQS